MKIKFTRPTTYIDTSFWIVFQANNKIRLFKSHLQWMLDVKYNPVQQFQDSCYQEFGQDIEFEDCGNWNNIKNSEGNVEDPFIPGAFIKADDLQFEPKPKSQKFLQGVRLALGDFIVELDGMNCKVTNFISYTGYIVKFPGNQFKYDTGKVRAELCGQIFFGQQVLAVETFAPTSLSLGTSVGLMVKNYIEDLT